MVYGDRPHPRLGSAPATAHPAPLRRAPSPSSTSRNGRSGRSSNGGLPSIVTLNKKKVRSAKKNCYLQLLPKS
ncbi:hypothetical protein HanIR_Chr04g0162731 [Helianthus annuus]|nr:hypothetical protein HanIR_Chr04g0162731 [Helianthus annuus]